MKPETGLLLRMIGPLVEIACLAGLLSGRGRGRTVAGWPVENLYYVGLAVGFLLVVAGLTLVRRTRPTRRPDLDLDFDPDRGDRPSKR